ncbi:YjgF-like protein [Punctularia strigosozonata HHB-11173 SS5]|uniref:YjgF-like protein n=1 Tax=Punctularia strigosozonata (strain HHB-11173) TaxID=741275 RepID=UPI0004418356|nr:YjgF-like protein [Punctularia strigosozonata HHB-11173 SS5]EIN06386.1 YjgF-like protein [Punctularia strigosozonata HHB-11173 SS5]
MSTRQIVFTEDANPPLPIYSQAVKSKGHVFLSGNIGCDANLKLADGGVQGQTKAALENIIKVLKASGVTLDDVVKVNIYLTNLARDFVPMNEVYAQYWKPGQFPARTCIGVAALPLNADVEIELVAALPEA